MDRINKESNGLKTVSLFSGIGGMDLGFIYNGFEIVWANDMDKYAVQTYKANIDDNIIEGDLNDYLDDIPSHDVLLAGFPCQPFSMMGKQKGFDDERGTLFFTIEQILRKHKTKIIVLENVKNLLTHDKGRTFKKMKKILEEDLGYHIEYSILDTKDYGIPQTRRRVFVVGFLKEVFDEVKFKFPKAMDLKISTFDLLDENVDEKYFLSEKILPTILADGSGGYKSKSEINLSIARPLTATMHKMHRANQDNYYEDKKSRSLFNDSDEKRISNIRRLTPNECRKLQGLTFFYKSGFLFIELPSKRKLAYVKPRIVENRFGGESVTYEGVGSTKKWERIESYGPKFVENIVQAIARDILLYSMKTLRLSDIVATVHDEIIIEADKRVSLDVICEQMAKTPPWAKGLLLDVDGYECEFYKKN